MLIASDCSIGRALEENRLVSTRLTGDLTAGRRDNNLRQFRANNNCNVLLASLQATGVGIDLQCAQNVYLMASLISHSAESQGSHRLLILHIF